MKESFVFKESIQKIKVKCEGICICERNVREI